MQSLKEIASLLNSTLEIASIPDYPKAMNGLQLANTSGAVRKVAAAVDACEASISAAVEAGANLLIVHHGLFWNSPQMITGGIFRKYKMALDHDLAIYSAHLPLDYHAEWGNDVLLGKACGLENPATFGDKRSLWFGHLYDADLDRSAFIETVRGAVGGGRVHLCPGGPARIKKLAVLTGGAGEQIAKVAATGADTFLTGEGPHWSYPLAEELGMNLIYAGHYATETFGVKALGAMLQKTFGLDWTFIDHPTGL